MHVDMPDIAGGLGGGAVIGAAATLLLLSTGKVTGISGIAHSLVTARNLHSLIGWRLPYILGLVIAGIVLARFRPEALGTPNTLHPIVSVVAGLLVGYGTRLGSGCTSGHGVCGIPRFSPRSIVAVLTFMATGMLAAGITRIPKVYDAFHTSTPFTFGRREYSTPITTALAWIPTVLIVIVSFFLFQKNSWLRQWMARCAKDGAEQHHHGQHAHDKGKHPDVHQEEPVVLLAHLFSVVSAFVFGIALGWSGMTNPERVARFLDPFGNRGWDPTLGLVMGGAVAVNVITFFIMRQLKKPWVSEHRTYKQIIVVGRAPSNMKVDWKLIAGSAMFGLGWGLAGYCPGPVIVSLAGGSNTAGLIVPAMLLGMVGYELTLGAGLFHHRHHHTHSQKHPNVHHHHNNQNAESSSGPKRISTENAPKGILADIEADPCAARAVSEPTPSAVESVSSARVNIDAGTVSALSSPLMLDLSSSSQQESASLPLQLGGNCVHEGIPLPLTPLPVDGAHEGAVVVIDGGDTNGGAVAVWGGAANEDS